MAEPSNRQLNLGWNYWQLIDKAGFSGPKEEDGGGFTVYLTVPKAPALLELACVPNVATTIPALTAFVVGTEPEAGVPGPFSVVW